MARNLFKGIINNNGATLVYILASFMIVSFIGVTMIKTSFHESTSSSDFASTNKIRIASKSGILQTIKYIEGDPNAFLPTLQSLCDNPELEKWVLGDNSSFTNLMGQYSFRSKIKNIDKTNFSVNMICEVKHKDGYVKTITGIYKLNGVDFKKTVSEANSYALYVNGDYMTFQSKFHLVGNLYTPGNLTFIGSWCSGSIFDGNVISAGTAGATLQGSYTFNGKFYTAGRITYLPGSVGGQTVTFNGLSGFEKGMEKGGAYTSVVNMNANTYLNDYLGAGSPVINNLNSNTFYHDGSVDAGKVNNGIESNQGGTIDIPNKMGFSANINPPPPTLHLSAIAAGKILNWNNLAMDAWGNAGDAGYDISDLPTVYSSYAALWGGLVDGFILEEMCNYAKDNGVTWNGFTVIEIPAGRTIYPVTNNGTFSDSVIFINKGSIDQSSMTAAGWYNSSSSSITVILNYGDYNCGQYTGNNPTDLFRAYIFNTANAGLFQLNPATRVFYNFEGAIHNMRDPATATGQDIWYPDNATNLSKIVYNKEMMQFIESTGLAENIGGGDPVVIVSDEIEIIDGTVGIEVEIMALQI